MSNGDGVNYIGKINEYSGVCGFCSALYALYHNRAEFRSELVKS